MSGICGWISSRLSPDYSDDQWARMSAGLPRMRQLSFSRAGKYYGIFAYPWQQHHAAGDDGEIIAVIDGHIRWLDPALKARAHERGDAATLVQAYRCHGRDIIATIGGEFSFVILEPARRKAVVAVDRFGSKPMAYALGRHGEMIFGSTVDAIRRSPAIEAAVDPQALFNYTYFHDIPSPGSVFNDIEKLQPGTLMTFEDNRIAVHSYWAPDFCNGGGQSATELQGELRDTLRRAVEQKLNNGASYACFLSGGLDSSTIAGMAAQYGSGTKIAYTMGFEAAGYDEMYFSRLAAQRFGLELREYYVTQQDIIDAMPVIAAGYDEPFGNSSAVPTLMCARRAQRDGITCMLAGDGGDELFGGNERYAKQKVFEIYNRLPPFLRIAVLDPLASSPLNFFPFNKARSYVAQAKVPMPERLESYNLFNREPLETIFEYDFLKLVDRRQPLQLQTERYQSARANSLVDRMIWYDWKFTLADNDLRKVTRSCEIAGLDVVYPMLNAELVDLSLRIPSKLKVNRLKLRYLYKRAMRDFLPNEIINKRKHGFGLPFGVWLASSGSIQDFLYPQIEALGRRGIFKPSFLKGLLEANRTEHAAFYGNQLYVLGMLELWLQAHDIKS